jgi:hypothetical protein
VELRGFEPLTYSMRTRLSGRLLPQAVLTVRKTAGQTVGSVGHRKLPEILLRTHCVPTADRPLGRQTMPVHDERRPGQLARQAPRSRPMSTGPQRFLISRIQAAAAFAAPAHHRHGGVPKSAFQREGQLVGSGAVPPVQPAGPSSGPLIAASGAAVLFGCGNPAGHFVDVS